jgi:HD-like signal output (HDOD) protein
MQTTTLALQRVLFVDDEPSILSGLSRMLRPLRHEIQSEFVESGPEALARLKQEPFDIVVADMRMPTMDGAALLDAVQRAYPHTIRIVLSGHADVGATLRAVPVAHQFLSKPCDATTLRGVLLRAVGLHSLLEDRELQAMAAGMREIPARPETYATISKMLASPASTSVDIANVVARDVATAAKLLKIVNSSFFGLPRRVTSIESAINYLGTGMLRSLILATAASAGIGPRAREIGYDLESNQTRALFSANLAMQFFTEKNAREDAFAAALLQNVGELLLIAGAPDAGLCALKRARDTGIPLEECERELHMISHAHIGAYLLGAWGLPYTIVEAVAHHHDPSAVLHDKLDLVDAVNIATLLADHAQGRRSDGLELAKARLLTLGEENQLARVEHMAARLVTQSNEGS